MRELRMIMYATKSLELQIASELCVCMRSEWRTERDIKNYCLRTYYFCSKWDQMHIRVVSCFVFVVADAV